MVPITFCSRSSILCLRVFSIDSVLVANIYSILSTSVLTAPPTSLEISVLRFPSMLLTLIEELGLRSYVWILTRVSKMEASFCWSRRDYFLISPFSFSKFVRWVWSSQRCSPKLYSTKGFFILPLSDRLKKSVKVLWCSSKIFLNSNSY